MPRPYRTLEDIMVGGRTRRPDYNPNKRGLVDGPGGYWGAHHGDPTGNSGNNTGGNPNGGNKNDGNKNSGGLKGLRDSGMVSTSSGYGPAGAGGEAMGPEGNQGQNQGFLTAYKTPVTNEEWGDFLSNPNISPEDKDKEISNAQSTNVEGLTWGGPHASRAPIRDYSNLQKFNDLPEAIKNQIGLEDVNQDVYNAFFGKIDSTTAQKNALARALGYSTVSAMESAIGPMTTNALAAYHSGLTSLQAHVDAISNLGQQALTAVTPQEDATFSDLATQYGKLGLTGVAADNVMGLIDTYGFDPVAKALGALGTEAVMANQMFGLVTGTPSQSASVQSWTKPNGETLADALAEGTINAQDVMKSNEEGDMMGSMGFGIANSALGQALGMNSYAGGYVDADKAIALGFSYAGPTQGMTDAQFGMVQGHLADPFGQTMSQIMGSSAAPNYGGGNTSDAETMAYLNDTQQGSSGDEGTGTGDSSWLQGEEVAVDTTNLDPAQMQIFNQMKGYGYSDEYAYQYANMII